MVLVRPYPLIAGAARENENEKGVGAEWFCFESAERESKTLKANGLR